MQKIMYSIAFGYIAIVVLVIGIRITDLAQFSAPFDIIPAPDRPPLAVQISYSPEQQEWIRAAAAQFTATAPQLRGRPIQLNLRSQSSQTMIDSIVSGQSQPTAIIPASSMQIALLKRSWAARHAGPALVATDGPNKPQPIALSPLVLVGWKDRMGLLFTPENQDIWRRLHDALVKSNWGDPSLGGNADWGPVKLGHASPRSANSGVEALTLLAYAYHNKAQGLTSADVANPGFQSWLKDIEDGVTSSAANVSTDELFKAFLSTGPSAYDLALVYENQAVRAISGPHQSWGDLQIIYPPATTWSDHPYTVLEATWSSAEQQEAARMFLGFLLSDQAQRLALQNGFRPANANISLTDNSSNNPFLASTSAGIKIETTGSVAVPEPEVLDALLKLWEQQGRR